MATHSSSIGGLEVEVMEPAGWRLSWGAVLAGVIVSLVAHILLNLLGIGIGVASTEPNTTPDAQTIQSAGLAASIGGLWQAS